MEVTLTLMIGLVVVVFIILLPTFIAEWKEKHKHG